MRFKWRNDSSKSALICMVMARVRFGGKTIEDAVSETLANGHHCKNPEAISEETLRRLRKEVEDKLALLDKAASMGKTRRGESRTAGRERDVRGRSI